MSSIELIQGHRPAAALLHPLRRRILEALQEADSASGLARRLDLPRQMLNYHLRTLEKEGLLELVEERRKGNCTERLLRCSARAFVINPEPIGSLGVGADALTDRFSSSYLVAAAARSIRDIGALRGLAAKSGKRLATFTLEGEIRFASAAARAAFLEELSDRLRHLTAKYHEEKTPGGRRFRLLLVAHPSPPESSSKGEARHAQKS